MNTGHANRRNPRIPDFRVLFFYVGLYLSLAVLFSLLYYGLPPNHFKNLLPAHGYWKHFYFAVTVSTTVGFGDISPSSGRARFYVTAQMILSVSLIGFLYPLAVAAASERKMRAKK